MGLESATFISGLTPSWPPSGDPKSQGDDHLRLIKSVLQSTFPSATGPLYFPKTEGISAGPMVLDATDQGNLVIVDTTGGDVSVALPTGFTTTNAGWSCEIIKVSADTNGAMVTPASGLISSKVGATASVRVGAYYEPARFLWTGTLWVCVKPGVMVGTSFNYDGVGIPRGCLALDGSTFNGTTFAELLAILGTTTLRDKRGRLDVGAGTGSGLTNRVSGTPYGLETAQLSLTHLPPQTPSGSISNGAITVNISANGNGAILRAGLGGNQTGGGSFGFGDVTISATASQNASTFTGNGMPGQNQSPFSIIPPMMGTQKLIRAC